jgi:protocatechuate 3,4-dioxygenase beta subunit
MLTIRDSQMQAMAKALPGKQTIQPCNDTATWIEVRLSDEDGNAMAGAKYRIQLPDFSIMEGALDDEGKVRFDGIVPGQSLIDFPGIDGREWRPR